MARINTHDLIHDFEKDCRLRGLVDGTIKEYLSELRIFTQFLQEDGGKHTNRDVLTVKKETLQEFLKYLKQKRKLSVKRMENYFSGLNAFYDYLTFEEIIKMKPPVVEIRKRYIRRYKRESEPSKRKLISITEMATLINSILDIRDKAIAVLLAKTGIRRQELVTLDITDIDWRDNSILLKKASKRSNRTVFFDNECAIILRRWLKMRGKMMQDTNKALFMGAGGKRLNRSGVYNAITLHAEKIGVHNPTSKKLEDHFTTHCFRHWNTTMLLRAGMPREYVKELRGDKRREAIDIYHHIDREDLKKSYLGCIPQLGIT